MDGIIGLVAVGTGYIAILMPVLLIWVIFSYSRKTDKDKYDAMVDISKNLENESDIKTLLASFEEEKKPIEISLKPGENCLISISVNQK